MIKSMTGYGRTESALAGKRIVAEIKSLNHKNLEISVRFPNVLSPLEIPIKKRISDTISRGRVEISIRFDTDQGATDSDRLFANIPLIRNYYELLVAIKEEFGLSDPVTLDLLANVKNGIYAAEAQIDPEETWPVISNLVDRAVDALMDMKKIEGTLLYADFTERVNLIKTYLDSMKPKAPQVVQEYKVRLSERLEELANGVQIDPLRLAQEIAIMAEKIDITEEIVRLDSHIHQLRDLLESLEPVGRKMDFLFQEMHREINTIGSKSSDLDISRNVIDIKTELAKLREQVQNIE